MMERTAYYSESRGLGGLRQRTEDVPPPGQGEVQVSVRAIGLNFADVISVLGLYSAAPARPFIPGLEFAGVVEVVGAGVKDYKIGDKVVGVRFFGAYASAVNVDARFLAPLPDDWAFTDGAAYIVASLTAYYALVDQARVQQGETVLIQSAVGGVGLAALKIAKAYDCFVIGVVGDQKKLEYAKTQGYDAVVVRGKGMKGAVLEALNGRLLNVVLDTMGGSDFTDMFNLLAPQGRIVSYGYSQYVPKTIWSYPAALWRYLRRPKIDSFRLDNRMVAAFNLVYLFDKADQMRGYLRELQDLNLGKPSHISTFAFDELPKALGELSSGKTVGKIIVML